MMLLAVVPLVGLVFAIWLLFALPSNHGRSLLWGLGLLVPFIGMYAYDFTLDTSEPHEASWVA